MSHSLHACLTIPRCAVQLAACRGRFERSLPIIVAHGTTDRATVVDMSAAAAEAGIYRGMLVWAARRRCRSVRIISYDADAMAYASTVVMEVLKRHTDAITDEPPDRWLFRLCALGGDCARAPTIAEQLCEELRAETDLGGHLGLASHPTLARIAAQVAAERDAPAIVVPTDGIAAFLHPLPVTMLPGVGVKTQIALERLGVTTIGHLVDIPCSHRSAGLVLRSSSGRHADSLQQKR
jgi:DNA polymerase IV